MKENVLVTLADKNFIDQAKQLFSSAYWNGGWDGDYLLLAHEDIPDEELEWFRKKGILIFRCKALVPQKQVGIWGHTAVVLNKFYLFTPYFKRWKHIVYLDADIIVRGSLSRLTKVEKFAAPNAHATSLRQEFVKQTKENKKLFKELKKQFPLKGRAFNSGIMAINTEIIKDDTFDSIMELYNKFGSLNKYGEEPTLNLFFYKKWELLSFLFNIYPYFTHKFYGIPYEKIEGIIIHFVHEVTSKPWSENSFFHKEWKENLKKAEDMDLDHIPPGKEIWPSYAEEQLYLKTLAFRKIIGFYRRIYYKIDWAIGQIGIFIKKLSPQLYETLVNLKK